MEHKLSLINWLREREANCVRIAAEKQGDDKAGWLEDGEYMRAAVDAIVQRDELALRLKGAAEKLRVAWQTTDDDELADEWARYENHINELLAKVKGGE